MSTAQPPTHESTADDAGAPAEQRSVGDLLSAVSADLTTLLRQEVELAKAEVRQSATRAGKGAGMLAGAGVAGHMVLVFISLSACWGIAQWVGLAWGALIIAGVWVIIAAVLAASGRSNLKKVEGLPRTTETTKNIPNAVTGREGTS